MKHFFANLIFPIYIDFIRLSCFVRWIFLSFHFLIVVERIIKLDIDFFGNNDSVNFWQLPNEFYLTNLVILFYLCECAIVQLCKRAWHWVENIWYIFRGITFATYVFLLNFPNCIVQSKWARILLRHRMKKTFFFFEIEMRS